MERLTVACAADGRYALPLAVMLHSAARNLSPGYALAVYAVDGGLSAAERERIERSAGPRVSVEWIEPCRGAFAGLPLWGRMPIATYDKLAVGAWMPAGVRQVLWLDADLLVIGNLAEITPGADSAAVVHAVADPRVPLVSSRFGIAAYAALGFDATAKYFNAGVMVIDLERWRAEEVESRAFAYLHRYRDDVYFWDQEALNVALRGRWEELAPDWNRQTTTGPASTGATTPARILHFSGYLKPWRYRSSSHHHDLYFSYLDGTAWAGWRPPFSWSARGVDLYESSSLRRYALPVEHLALSVVRAATFHYASPAEVAPTFTPSQAEPR